LGNFGNQTLCASLPPNSGTYAGYATDGTQRHALDGEVEKGDRDSDGEEGVKGDRRR